MRCPTCGNEVGLAEAFCGQCGAPNMPPARATEMMNTSSPRSGLLSKYTSDTTNNPNNPNNPNTQNFQNTRNTNTPFTPTQQQPFGTGTGMPPQPMTYNPNNYVGTTHPPTGHLTQQPPFPTATRPQSSFHQDATEAISVPFSHTNQVYPTGYPAPIVPGAMPPEMYPQQYSPQQQAAFQNGNYAATAPSFQQPTFVTNQGYDPNGRGQITPPPHKPRNGAVVAIVSICIVITLLAVGGLGAVLLLRNHGQTSTANQTTPIATNAQTATTALSPTAAPSPTQTVEPTVTPTAAITPTVTTPTPAPADANFSWCNQSCTNNGFQTEYPNGWTLNSTPSGNGLLFTPTAQPDIYAAFKLPGQTSDTAQNILTGDLQTSFASKDGYIALQTAATTSTIAGETWVTSVIYYMQNGQKERVAVYVTVHQGRAYIIELQALDTQFDVVNNQYFINMIGRFQFQPLPGQ